MDPGRSVGRVRRAGREDDLGYAGGPGARWESLGGYGGSGIGDRLESAAHRGGGLWDADVDVLVIEERIREICRTSAALAIGADPARWSRTLDVLTQEGWPALEWPWTPARSIPACTRFREAVVNRQLSHSGDEYLSTHIANAVVTTDARGARITRESRYSSRRIDLAVASVIAHDVACDLMSHAFKIW